MCLSSGEYYHAINLNQLESEKIWQWTTSADSIFPQMNTIVPHDHFKPIRIGGKFSGEL